MSENKQRITELLIDRATDSLSPEEQQELSALLEQLASTDERFYDELVAGMQESHLESDMSQLPPHIRSQVINKAEDFVGPEDSIGPSQKSESNFKQTLTHATGMQRRELLGWLATAACLALATFLWFRPANVEVRTAQYNDLITPSDQKSLDKFLGQESDDIFEVELGEGGHASGKGSKATVYWNRRLKRGFLAVRNFAVNQPTAQQYQLWIIDKKRGIGDRPNAGVFNVSNNALNVYAFQPGLPISEAQGFAVTVEKPGGVAVSDLKRISAANLGTEE